MSMTAKAAGIDSDPSKRRVTDETLGLRLPLTKEPGLRARPDTAFIEGKINAVEAASTSVDAAETCSGAI
jgi:hypothetical protein